MSLLSNDAGLNQTVMDSSTQEGTSNLLLKDKGPGVDKTGAEVLTIFQNTPGKKDAWEAGSRNAGRRMLHHRYHYK